MCFTVVFLTVACDTADTTLVREAKEAEIEGRVISNEYMEVWYPQSFKPGFPQYIERDFEAGANFICDEIKIKYQRDICSEEQIRWRR